jgi:hypothetical protein
MRATRLAALKAIEGTWPAPASPRCLSPIQEWAQLPAEDQHFAAAGLHRREPPLDPIPNSVAMDAEQAGDFGDGITAVDLGAARVDTTLRH